MQINPLTLTGLVKLILNFHRLLHCPQASDLIKIFFYEIIIMVYFWTLIKVQLNKLLIIISEIPSMKEVENTQVVLVHPKVENSWNSASKPLKMRIFRIIFIFPLLYLSQLLGEKEIKIGTLGFEIWKPKNEAISSLEPCWYWKGY